MSPQLIARSSDLHQLREDGYHLELRGDVLLVHDVPYVTPSKAVARGTLVTQLELSGDATVQPTNHVAYFIGEQPSDAFGAPLAKVVIGSGTTNVGTVQINHTMSKKPTDNNNRYRDYRHKIETYVALLSVHAEALEPGITARTYPVITPDQEDPDSVFEYLDTATTRSGITEISAKLHTGPVALVGVGGTGGYILDLLSKTPVAEIHLYDGDRFIQHNAFRSPGAASHEELSGAPKKVDYFAGRYSAMRKRIVPHDVHVTEDNIEELRAMSFVFVSIDDGAARKFLVSKLEEFGVAFVDVGLGIQEGESGSLFGQLRTTLSTHEHRDHVHDNRRIPFGTLEGVNDDYKHNIQIAPLNMLNAALAVVKWQKRVGFLSDLEGEHHSVYATSGNTIINEDQL